MMTHTLTLGETPFPVLRHLRNLLNGLQKVSAAHDASRLHRELADRDLGDVCLPRDDVLGVTSYQPALPFFMQPGFGTRSR